MSSIQIVYCRENEDIASQLTQTLERVGIPFTRITNTPDLSDGRLAKEVLASEEPVLLILTDNFLKSRSCMVSALQMLQTLVRQNRILVVVADGRVSRDGGQHFESVPTQFDRVVHAIQYMNFWQTAYLDANDALPHSPAEERETQEADLEKLRAVANEIGEFFSALRDSGYVSRAQLEADDFALFFRHFGLQDWHSQFRQLKSLETTLSQSAGPAPAHSNGLTETPVVRGPLVPVPAEEPESQEEILSLDGIEFLLQEMEAEALETNALAEPAVLPAAQEPAITTEPEPSPEVVEQEIQQNIRDAWFWLEKGYPGQGLELLKLSLEQYPDHAGLQSEYARALEQYSGETAEETSTVVAETDIQVPELLPTPSAPETDHADNTLLQEAISYDQMGENALAKGDYLLAKYCWDRVTEIQPQFPGIFRKLALLTSDHLKEYKETAVHYLEEALLAAPQDPELHYRLAVLLQDHLGEPEKALRHFREVVVYQPEHAQAWLALARASRAAGDLDQAETLYRHAIQLQPALQSETEDALFIPQQQASAPEPEILEEDDAEPVFQPETETRDEDDAEPAFQLQPEPEPEILDEDATEPVFQPETETQDEEATEPLFQLQPKSEAETREEDSAEPVFQLQPETETLEEDATEPVFQLQPETETREEDAIEPVFQLQPEHEPVASEEEATAPVFQLQPETETLEAAAAVPAFQLQPEPVTQDEDDASDIQTGAIGNTAPDAPLRLTVLITGGTSGIGRATAEYFARQGHRVMLTGRREDRLEILKEQFQTAYQAEIHTLSFDVRHPASVQEALDNLPEEWQDIDVLINNAGLAKGLSPIHEGSLDHWETMIDTNIKGLLYVTRCIAPGMVRRRKGHIINIGSSAGKEVYTNGNVYCATKFAVDALTRAIRLDLHAYNIRVSQVSPGHVEETEFAITRFDGDAQKARIYDDFQPLKASDVADAIYYMATRPAHVNVQDIVLFGTQQASATVVNRSGRE